MHTFHILDTRRLTGLAERRTEPYRLRRQLGEIDAIAPAVKKGNTELRDWLNDELTKLGEEKFFHKDFDSTLKPAYGDSVQADDVVVEGGKI